MRNLVALHMLSMAGAVPAMEPEEREMFSEEFQKFYNGGLTDKEVEEGYEMCPVFGKINLGKAMRERAEAARSEYEAFDNMHRADGVFSKSKLRL